MSDDLWRPSCWRVSVYDTTASSGWRFEATVLLAVAVWNVLANEVIPDSTHVVTNLAAGVALVWYARRNGLTWDDLGMRIDRVGRGLVVGGCALLVIVAAVTVTVLVPASRAYFVDDRFLGESAMAMLFEVVVRIPLATAAFEEVVFRGVMLGMFLRRMTVLQATVATAFVFGVWHILPTLEGLSTNPVGDDIVGFGMTLSVLVATVAILTVAGLALSWLRFRANSLVAPFLAHVGINTTSYVAGWIIVNRGWG